MSVLQEYVRALLVEEAEAKAVDRALDDVLDDVIRDAAPEIVRSIREREVDEDIDEFIDGALHGSWDSALLDYRDPPRVGAPAEVRDEGDREEVTEMYLLGYGWGWDNPGKVVRGEEIPADIRREMIGYALENFESRLTEEFVIDAVEKAVTFVKTQMSDIHHLIKQAKDRFGWKIAPAIGAVEVIEHFVLPKVLGALHPIFYGLAAVPTVEILLASALAIIKSRKPAAEEVELPPGHLDWYEEDQASPTAEGVVRRYIREALNEGVEFREVDSPLSYNRGGHVKRLALCDTSISEPNPRRDFGFNDEQEWDHYGRSGRRLKKARKGRFNPGVSDVCIIGFLDYHSQGKTSDGNNEYWYIDYMKTRGDKGGQGIASKLVDEFFKRYVQPGDRVHFGKMMRKEIGHLKDKMAEKYSDVSVIGAVNF